MIPFPKQNAKANWTVIFQINGENDLLEGMKDIYDKIAEVGSSYELVNFIVLFDGLKLTNNTNKERINNNEYPCVYYVKRFEYYKDARALKQYQKQENIADIDNLSFILNEIKISFPAEHYAYFYLGHGGPGRTDINDAKYITKLDRRRQDETDDDVLNERLLNQRPDPKESWNYQGYSPLISDRSIIIAFYFREGYKELTYYGLSKAFKKVGFTGDHRLDFILLDCCWGQLIENSDSFEPVAKYFVASADQMPGGGIGYVDFCNFLIKHPQIKLDELANAAVAINFLTNYDDYLSSEEYSNMGVSLTCSALKHFGSLKEKLNMLSDYLIVNIFTLTFPIRRARKMCIDYTYEPDPETYNMYNIDLLWFLENLQYNNANVDTQLNNILSELIAYIETYFKKSHLASNYPEPCIGDRKPYIGGRGLTITFPMTLEQFNNPNCIYSQAPENFDTWKWKDFLLKYLTYIEEIRNNSQQHIENFRASTKSGDPKKELVNYLESFKDQETGQSKWGKMIRYHRPQKPVLPC